MTHADEIPQHIKVMVSSYLLLEEDSMTPQQHVQTINSILTAIQRLRYKGRCNHNV